MRKYSLFAIGLIFLLLLFPSFLFAEDALLEIHFVNAGIGDSIFIDLPDGSNMLVDAGGPAAGPVLADYLGSMGVERIDRIVFTHAHDDHFGGVFELLSRFRVGMFYDNGFDNSRSELYGNYLEIVRKDLSRYRMLRAGDKLVFGKVKMEVINPMPKPFRNLNEDSIVIRLQYRDIAVLLTGDIGAPAEKRLLEKGTELKSTLLKVGHHGDTDVCTREFLAAVRPSAAVITAGKGNKYNRPKPAPLKRLKDAGIKVYRTDLDGHIVFRSDGKHFSIHSGSSLNGESK